MYRSCSGLPPQRVCSVLPPVDLTSTAAPCVLPNGTGMRYDN
jgi:hypothetical protein